MSPLRVPGLLARFFLEGFRRMRDAAERPEPEGWKDDEVTCAWLGHATVLLNLCGVRVLTDPVLGPRCGLRAGPVTIGPRRLVKPALRVEELPELDVVLITHGHMDHLDLRTLGRLRGRPHAVTAAGLRDLLKGLPFEGITELQWDECATVATRHGELRVTARKVAHWGARMGNDDWRGYCGFVLEREGRRVGFAGDTARTDFRHWAAEGGLDLMAVPIGAYNPWIAAHCTPEEALEMADEAGARYLLPVHHSTFKLSAEPMDEPLRRFRAGLGREPWRLAVEEIGGTFRLEERERARDGELRGALPGVRLSVQ